MDNDYYGYTIYYLGLNIVVCIVIYIIIFIVIKLLHHYSKIENKTYGKLISNLGYSSIILFILYLISFIVYNINISRQNKEQEIGRKIRKEKIEREFQKKTDSLNQIILTGKDISKNYFELGLLYRKKGKWNESIKFYKKSIEVDSTNSSTHSEIAYNYRIKKELKNSLFHYKKAYKHDTTQVEFVKIIETIKKQIKQ